MNRDDVVVFSFFFGFGILLFFYFLPIDSRLMEICKRPYAIQGHEYLDPWYTADYVLKDNCVFFNNTTVCGSFTISIRSYCKYFNEK